MSSALSAVPFPFFAAARRGMAASSTSTNTTTATAPSNASTTSSSSGSGASGIIMTVSKGLAKLVVPSLKGKATDRTDRERVQKHTQTRSPLLSFATERVPPTVATSPVTVTTSIGSQHTVDIRPTLVATVPDHTHARSECGTTIVGSPSPPSTNSPITPIDEDTQLLASEPCSLQQDNAVANSIACKVNVAPPCQAASSPSETDEDNNTTTDDDESQPQEQLAPAPTAPKERRASDVSAGGVAMRRQIAVGGRRVRRKPLPPRQVAAMAAAAAAGPSTRAPAPRQPKPSAQASQVASPPTPPASPPKRVANANQGAQKRYRDRMAALDRMRHSQQAHMWIEAGRCGVNPIGSCANQSLSAGIYCPAHTCTATNADRTQCLNVVRNPHNTRFCAQGFHSENGREEYIDELCKRGKTRAADRRQARNANLDASRQLLEEKFGPITPRSPVNKQPAPVASTSINPGHFNTGTRRTAGDRPWGSHGVDKWWVGKWEQMVWPIAPFRPDRPFTFYDDDDDTTVNLLCYSSPQSGVSSETASPILPLWRTSTNSTLHRYPSHLPAPARTQLHAPSGHTVPRLSA